MSNQSDQFKVLQLIGNIEQNVGLNGLIINRSLLDQSLIGCD